MRKIAYSLAVIFLIGCQSKNLEPPRTVNAVPAPTNNLPDVVVERRVASVNQKITHESIRDLANKMFETSRIESTEVSPKTVKWMKDNLKQDDPSLSLDSTVYYVSIKGDLVWPFPGEPLDRTNLKNLKRNKGNHAELIISSETGSIIYATMPFTGQELVSP